jgi:hypothetical protein
VSLDLGATVVHLALKDGVSVYDCEGAASASSIA